MKKLYVRNTSEYSMSFPLTDVTKVTDAMGKEEEIVVDRGLITFGVKTYDDRGNQLHTGYTQVEKSQIDKLSKMPMFKNMLKNGTLVLHDEPPADALLDSQLVDSQIEEIAKLKAEVARLESLLEEGSSAVIEENKRLKEEIAEFEEGEEGYKLTIEQLQKELAELKESNKDDNVPEF